MKIIQAKTIWSTEFDPSKTKTPSDKTYSVQILETRPGHYEVVYQYGKRGKAQQESKTPLYAGSQLWSAERAFNAQIRKKSDRYDKEQTPLFPRAITKEVMRDYFSSLRRGDPFYEELEKLGVVGSHFGTEKLQAIMEVSENNYAPVIDSLEALMEQFYQ